MSANKHTTHRILGSDMVKVDKHVIEPHEYDEVPEIVDKDLSRGALKRASLPVASDPRKQVTIRLPESVLERWRASGAGWQTRMADILEKRAP